MKTNALILILSAILFASGQIRAQDDLPYRPFKSFNNDTVQYLDYNFFIRNDQYTGKKISDVINDLKLPIISMSTTLELSTSEANKIVGIDLVINKRIQWSAYDYCVSITLVNPILSNDRDFFYSYKVVRDSDGNGIIPWTTQLYEYLKDKEIKSVTTNSYLIEERRKLIDMHTPEGNEQLKKLISTERANWRKRIQAEKQTIKK